MFCTEQGRVVQGRVGQCGAGQGGHRQLRGQQPLQLAVPHVVEQAVGGRDEHVAGREVQLVHVGVVGAVRAGQQLRARQLQRHVEAVLLHLRARAGPGLIRLAQGSPGPPAPGGSPAHTCCSGLLERRG